MQMQIFGFPLSIFHISIFQISTSSVANNNHTHRISRAFRNDDDGSFDRMVNQMKDEQAEYFNIVNQLPPLPDCEFAKKIFSVVE